MRSKQTSPQPSHSPDVQGLPSYFEVMEPSEQVKLLPLKARLIFKKAMKELDQVDLINSDQMPMSRQRIRAILKKMKDNVDNGNYEEKLSKNEDEKKPRIRLA